MLRITHKIFIFWFLLPVWEVINRKSLKWFKQKRCFCFFPPLTRRIVTSRISRAVGGYSKKLALYSSAIGLELESDWMYLMNSCATTRTPFWMFLVIREWLDASRYSLVGPNTQKRKRSGWDHSGWMLWRWPGSSHLSIPRLQFHAAL